MQQQNSNNITTNNAHKHIMLEIDRLLEVNGILIKTGQRNNINAQVYNLLQNIVNTNKK